MAYTLDAQVLVQPWSDGEGHTWTYGYADAGRLTREEDSTGERYLAFT